MIRTAAFFYALGLLLMPLELKPILHGANIAWVHPTLVLGFLSFVLVKTPVKDKMALWVVVYAFLSASVGYFFMAVSPDRENSSLYGIYIEPIRLCLYMIWFWLSVEFLSTRREFVLRWLAISATIQLALASYLYLALYDLVPVPDIVALYLNVYKMRQVVWFGDTPVYRMAGTFIESPPFGLFMFSCLVVFATFLAGGRGVSLQGDNERRWARLGVAVALIGAIASLSDEVLLAVITFGLFLYFSMRKRAAKPWMRKSAEILLGSLLLLGIAAYALPRVMEKWTEAAATKPGEIGTIGEAGGERMFHTRYGLQLLWDNPLAFFTGIGPGRYGDYVVKTGQYPSDVPIQVTPVAWLVEYGAFGTVLILSWLWSITKRAQQTYPVLAIGAGIGLIIANIAQGGWQFDIWFLALAFLYCCAARVEKPRLSLPR